MKTSTTIWILVAVLVVIGGTWYWQAHTPAPQEAAMENTQQAEENNFADASKDGGVGVSVNTVRLTDSGFSPERLTVSKGTTVTFINQTSGGMWVGADEHPSHTSYAGTSRSEHCPDTTGTAFDQCGNGNTYSFTFGKTGTWEYHNHVSSSARGAIIVTE